MANKLVECETCSNVVMEQNLVSLQTSKGIMKVCKKCATEHSSAKVEPTKVEETKTEAPETTAYLQQIAKVSDPEAVPHPDKPKEKFTQSQLFAEYLNDEQLKIEDIFKDREPLLAYAMLEDRIKLMESIVFEAKTRGSELLKKQRELDAKSGKNRWDKERRGENKSNLIDPRDSHYDSRKTKDKRVILTKIEGNVKAMMDMGNTDEEIINMMTATGKFKGIEIREAIEKFKVNN